MDSLQSPVTAEQTAQQQTQTSAPVQDNRQSQEVLERFNRLMERENTLRKRESSLTELQKKAERFDRVMSAFENGDVDSGLNEFGLDYDKVTERRLGSLGSESDKKLTEMEKVIKQLQERLSNEDKAKDEEKVTRAYESTMNELKELVDGSEDFELIKAFGQYDLVLQVAGEVKQATGKLLPLAEVAKEVESRFEQQLENIMKTKKAASKWSSFQQQSQQPQQAGSTVQQTSTKTLTGELGQEARTEQMALTKEELFERAMRRMQQQ